MQQLWLDCELTPALVPTATIGSFREAALKMRNQQLQTRTLATHVCFTPDAIQIPAW